MRKNFRFALATALCITALFQAAMAQNTSPYWSLAGNSNATSSAKLGTTNNVPMRFFTNNTERLRIDVDGWVGIGTNNPRGRLTLFNNGSTPAAAWVTAPSPIFVSYSESTAGNGDMFLAMAANTSTTRPNIIARRSRGTLASPSAVQNNDYINSLQASAYDGSAFQNSANVDFFVDGTPSSGNVPVRIAFSTGSNLGNRTERLVVKSNGNIGIGTANPTHKLAVNGTIQSKEVRVESGWADYVFDETYRLRPLAEVEAYVKTNKHLPGIASAKEIEQNGLALGETQKKMMEKIEELTLYIIDLQKQISQLQKEQKSNK